MTLSRRLSPREVLSLGVMIGRELVRQCDHFQQVLLLCSTVQGISCIFTVGNSQRGPFANFVDSPYYSESELCESAVTVSFSKYLPW
jgi:hypothetical protein